MTSDETVQKSELEKFSDFWKTEILNNLEAKTFTEENIKKISDSFFFLENSNLVKYLKTLADKDADDGENHVEDSLATIKKAINDMAADNNVYTNGALLMEISRANLALYEIEQYECENLEKTTKDLYNTIFTP